MWHPVRERLNRRKDFETGFLTRYVERVFSSRTDHSKYVVAWATFAGPPLREVPICIETPTIRLSTLVDARFLEQLLRYLDGQMLRAMPSIVYFQVDDHIHWVDICRDASDPAERRSAIQAALEEAEVRFGARATLDVLT